MIKDFEQRHDEPLLDSKRNSSLDKHQLDFDYQPPSSNKAQVDIFRNSNFLSKLFFCWPIGIMNKARKEPLKLEDLGGVSGENDAKNYLQRLTYYWDEKGYKTKKKNGLMGMIFRANLCKSLNYLSFLR